MEVRPYTADDWEELVTIYPAMWEDEWWDTVDEQVARDYLGTVLAYDSTVALVAVADDQLVGVAVAYDVARKEVVPDQLRPDDGVRRAYLDDIGVVPDYQHQHIGTALLEALLDRLRETYAAAVLRTHPAVEDGIQLYRHHGFSDTGLHDEERPERFYMVKQFSSA